MSIRAAIASDTVVIVADSEASNAVLRRYCIPAIEIERNILLTVFERGTVASYLIYTRVHVHTRGASIRECTSARTRRRTTGVAGFRQSNDNDRNVEGNRLHTVKMRRATRNIDERSRFNASAEAARKWTHATRRVLSATRSIGSASMPSGVETVPWET